MHIRQSDFNNFGTCAFININCRLNRPGDAGIKTRIEKFFG
jgi:hypothetical protein